MKKKFLTLLGGTLLGLFSMNVAADDVYQDVTGNYLKNADLEGEYTVQSSLNNGDRAIYLPEDWKIEYKNGYKYDMTALKAGDLQYSTIFKSGGISNNANGGNNTYGIRINNSVKGQQLYIYQEPNILSGYYRASADYWKSGSGGNCYVYAGDVKNATEANTTEWTRVSVEFSVEKEASIKMGFFAEHTNTYEKYYGFDNFKLEINLTATLNSYIAKAETAKGDDDSSEAEQLAGIIENTKGKASSTDVEVLNAAITELQEATAKYVAYKSLVKEISLALAYKVVTPDYTDLKTAINEASVNYLDATEESIKDAIVALETARQDANVSDYSYVSQNFKNTVNVNFNGGNNNFEEANADGYKSGTGYRNKWHSNLAVGVEQTKTLPAGTYVLSCISRGQAGADPLVLSVKFDDTTFETDCIAKGEGLGVDTNGEANFSEEGNYANSGKGFGWEYRFVKFTLSEEKEVTMSVAGQLSNTWLSTYNPILYADDISSARIALQAEIKTAEQRLIDTEILVGEGVLLYTETAVDDLESAIEESKSVLGSSTATKEDIVSATEFLKSSVTSYNNSKLPSADKYYYIIRSAESETDFYMSFAEGSGIKLSETPYKVKFADVSETDGNVKVKIASENNSSFIYYSGTGTNTWSLGATETTESAELWAITLSGDTYTIQGKNGLIGTDNDEEGATCYGNKSGDNAKWLIVEAVPANMKIHADVKWGTFVAPFDVTIPGDVEAYKCTEVVDGVITTEFVEGTAIPANTPVLVYSKTDVDETFYGKAVAIEGDPTCGVLVGTYEAKAAPVGSYVLQKNDGVFSFYKVVSGAQPTVGANRCYLSTSSSSTVLRFGGVTGIQSMEQQGESVIYDLTGRRVDAAVKGIYIVGGKKMLVK